MKRRDVLKSLSVVAGSTLCAPSAWSMLQPVGAPSGISLAVPIRGLVQKGGMARQPIRITLPGAASGVAAVTRLDGREVDRRTLAAGESSFDVLVASVDAPRKVAVEVEVAGESHRAEVTLQPVRKVEVYVLPHSHHDLGYTDLQANVEEKQMANISKGIALARRTADYPEGARFVWNLEVLWGADLYMQRKSQAEREELIEAVRKGWVGLNGMYANELTGLCRPEELVQLFRYAGEVGRQCGVPVDAAMLSDVPGFSWGTVSAMAQAGIRYFSAAPNFFDRIGTFMIEWQDKPFWWVSPSGKEKVLVWVPWTGYAMSHVMKLGADWVGKYQDRLDTVNFPYDISCIRWSGHGDNAEPDPELSEFIKDWNTQYEWPRFTIASTSHAFRAFDARYGSRIPEFKGDLTPYWEDGAGSSALETRMSRNASDRLAQAETLAAMLAPGTYHSADFHAAWRDVLLYSEHTWGAWNSVSDSENPFVTSQWEFKRNFAVEADRRSRALLEAVLGSYAGSGNTSAVDVHNASSWPRTEVVLVSRELSAAGDHVRDGHGKAVPSQRLASGELAFLAAEVPAFGSARFHISHGKAHAPAKDVRFHNNVLENGLVRVKLDAKSGNIVELAHPSHGDNLVDTAGGEAVNEYLFLQGKDISKIQSSGSATLVVEENGPLVASVRVESQAPGCNSLVRRVRLMAGADHVELSNTVDKQRAALNPHPGKGGPGGEFAQHGAKESVQFAFPFAVPQGQIRMDIPLAEMRPELDQLPGSDKNWLPVGLWIDVSNAEKGVTWVTLDAPLVEIGGITATMLGSQTHPEIWRKHIEPTQRFYSWAMNNHWGTNYRAYQQGKVEFRYALRPHAEFDGAAAGRLAIGLSQPLRLSQARTAGVQEPLLRLEPESILALACKPSEDGKAWIVRLFGASGEDQQARLTWADGSAPRLWQSNLSEQPIRLIAETIPVAAWDLVTVRVERRDT
ncbi:MAG TPA: glycoside hydrolase family 38 C-terminal domain-containing protein [Terracidiphilus sp.]|nr:glycoside hydrolase family 38 C-terminal domain-containing protein [Terracidiphilus sp.]